MAKDVSPEIDASKPILKQSSSAHDQSQCDLTIEELKEQITSLRKKFVIEMMLISALSFTCGWEDVIALSLLNAFASLLTGNWVLFGLSIA